jgi:hypothetical protein
MRPVGLISTFIDSFKKALGKKPAVDMEVVRSSGGTLGSTSGADAGAFDPLRPTPSPDTGTGVDTGAVSDTGSISVKSADPEEGGEIQ